MRTRHLAYAVATAVAVALVPAPALAGFNHSINATPTSVKPGESFTVSGTTNCPSVAYTVTFSYTNPEGATATATETGTTNAEGAYTQVVAVPEHATAFDPASVSSDAACGGGSQPSNTVTIQVEPYQGAMSATPNEGPVGTEVSLSGDTCWGDDIVVVFGDDDTFEDAIEVTDVTLNEDRTWTASFTIPEEAGPGNYLFAAECPGTEYEAQPFRVTATDEEDDEGTGGGEPTAAPPAIPVGGTPTFTG